MARAELLVDRLVATGFIRPGVLWRGLQCCRLSLARWRVSVLVGLSGLLVEPLAWLQALLFARRLRRLQLPDDPIKARIDQARSYSADRVGLSQPAERRLHSLVKPT